MEIIRGGDMITLQGHPICGGIAFGKLFMFTKEKKTIKAYHIDNTEQEITRFNNARKKAVEELEELYNKALKTIGQSGAVIFLIHRIMLEDEDYSGSIVGTIKQEHINAEAAVDKTCRNFVEIFEQMEDSYMRERNTDVKDISERIIKILSGKQTKDIYMNEPVIIAAYTLAPSETIQFDQNKILAFVTEKGSDNSHAAVLARKMNIPTITGVSKLMNMGYGGKQSIIDGSNGVIYIDPDRETIEKMNL